MARPKSQAPARRYHISGQSVVTVDGCDFYLGKHDTAESIARYAVLMSVYQSNGLALPDDFELESIESRIAAMLVNAMPIATNQSGTPILVSHVTAAYRHEIESKYANDPKECHRLGRLCDELDRHYGNVLAENFGSLALQEQRRRWVDQGLARIYCNRLTNSVRRIWKFAVSQELINESAWHRLESVEGLRVGQTTAHEKDAIKPVPIDDVRRTAAELSPVLRAMVRVHIGTGMRPSELCNMRPCDIDRSGSEWFYRPPKHKTANRGKIKAVPILADARAALTDYLNRDPNSYCFCPKESLAWFRSMQRVKRKSKVQPSQASRAVDSPHKQPGQRFTADSYRQAITRAAKRASVPHWHPYQLRHLAATFIRDALGVEAAQAMLGHSRAAMTEHYAKQNEQKSIDAAKSAPTL